MIPSDHQILLQLRLDIEATEIKPEAAAERALAVSNRDIKRLAMENLELDLQIPQAQALATRSGRRRHAVPRTRPFLPAPRRPLHIQRHPRPSDSGSEPPTALTRQHSGFLVRALMEQIQIMQQLADDQAGKQAGIRCLEAEARAVALAADTRVAQLEARIQPFFQIFPSLPIPKVTSSTNYSKRHLCSSFQKSTASNRDLVSFGFRKFFHCRANAGLIEYDTVLGLLLKLSGAPSAASRFSNIDYLWCWRMLA